MNGEVLISSMPDAPWLPPGSTAEAWVGADCAVPEPSIVVRLLLARSSTSGGEFFVVATNRGPDLPTLRLGVGPDRIAVADGLAELARAVHGRPEAAHRCVGYIRNVVPAPDDSYPHPTPWAHVPVFTPAEALQPACDGNWAGIDTSRTELCVRHWWPIVEHHLL